MTDHGNNRRGLMRYCVIHPDHETRPPFFVALRHSRERDALEALIGAGANGFSFYDDPAPRWGAYIHRLRKRGIDILTVREAHGGEHPGFHAKYLLISTAVHIAEGGAQ